jgi:hypothetical protein
MTNFLPPLWLVVSSMVSDDDWLSTHKGQYIDTIAEVWWCDDEWCDCTRAQIVERYQNLRCPGFVVRIGIWEGPFHSDGEAGADEELRAKRAELRANDPALEARINWGEQHGE